MIQIKNVALMIYKQFRVILVNILQDLPSNFYIDYSCYENARYTSVLDDSNFILRDYPAFLNL